MTFLPTATILTAAAFLLHPHAAAPDGTHVREEINRSHRLVAGAEVRVSGVAGGVTIETIDGDTAELRIVRSARTQAELDCYRTAVETSESRISIENVQSSDRAGCRNINGYQEVRLRLPRRTDVRLSSIAGNVEIGALGGFVRLDSIAGTVSLAGTAGAELTSIAGGLSVTDARPGARGIRIESIVGPVDLSFARNADADVHVSSVNGRVESVSPRLRTTGEDGDFHLKIGAGGPAVTISSVMGPVRLREY
ncbi:MAG TPA: hypothetical protein VGB08_04030 [Allosphingosinicella sp.]|jgi:hypothetical protein